jgi:hypothetical protein
MRTPCFLFPIIVLFLMNTHVSLAQAGNKVSADSTPTSGDTGYILKMDTLLHIYSSVSANQMRYTLVYSDDFKLVLAPNKINNLSFGLSYRYVDLGFSFTPAFLNGSKESDVKGKSEQFSFGTGFSFHRFKLRLDLSSVKGFYLQNSKEFFSTFPDSAYVIYPDLSVKYFSLMFRYNVNPRFSTAALSGGSQVQLRSTYTLLPALQFARFGFRDFSNKSGIQNEETYSTDLNLLLPLLGTWVFAPWLSATIGIGPSIGMDFFKSVALDNTNSVVLAKGTEFTFGYTFQSAISYNYRRAFAGFEYQNRRYGHELHDVSKLIKQYSYFQVYFGWRLKGPGFARKSLDWVNKVSPVDFD